MARCTTGSFVAWSLLVLTVFGARVPQAMAQAPLNSNVALSPPEGGWVVRLQWRYSRLAGDPTPLDREVHQSVVPLTVVYGATEKLAFQGTLRIIDREVEFGSGERTRDTGFGDILSLAKTPYS